MIGVNMWSDRCGDNLSMPPNQASCRDLPALSCTLRVEIPGGEKEVISHHVLLILVPDLFLVPSFCKLVSAVLLLSPVGTSRHPRDFPSAGSFLYDFQ